MGVELLGEAVITTRLDDAVNWARESSLWPFVFWNCLLRDRVYVYGC